MVLTEQIRKVTEKVGEAARGLKMTYFHKKPIS
jgi:hypothetical protein